MINFSKHSFTDFQSRRLSKDNCPANCFAQVKGLIWINNQPFWTYQCLCCHTYQFELGKTNFAWENIYD